MAKKKSKRTKGKAIGIKKEKEHTNIELNEEKIEQKETISDQWINEIERKQQEFLTLAKNLIRRAEARVNKLTTEKNQLKQSNKESLEQKTQLEQELQKQKQGSGIIIGKLKRNLEEKTANLEQLQKKLNNILSDIKV